LLSPYAARESGQRITAEYLAHRLRAFRTPQYGSAVASGSVVGLEGTELDEIARLVETNFDSDSIERIYVPYGSDISWCPTVDRAESLRKIGIVLRGVVEVQAPLHGAPNVAENRRLYPVTVLSAPALIWQFEAIPQSFMQQHQVKIFSGVQSFTVLLSLSQRQPWRQIAKRSSTTIPYHELTSSDLASEPKHTSLFKWSKRSGKGPTFTAIADGHSNDWSVELAVLDIKSLFTEPYSALSDEQRELRDVFYRIAIRRFGSSLRRHIPGYRLDSAVFAGDQADNIRSIASFIREIYTGQQPHHTCCFDFEQACNLFPAKTLVWNIYDFMRLAISQNIDLTKFGSSRRSTGDQLDQDVMAKFFNDFLYRFIYVPSFCPVDDVCLYSPTLWANENMNILLRNFDPKQKARLQKVFGEMQTESIRDFHIKATPAFFAGVPEIISDIIMDGGVFFRKVAENTPVKE
jgi:hypothetical protein